jgi:hypothetical protein
MPVLLDANMVVAATVVLAEGGWDCLHSDWQGVANQWLQSVCGGPLWLSILLTMCHLLHHDEGHQSLACARSPC